MQVFNDLTYLTIPSWPEGCALPSWLTIEVGVISGRLYFDYSEYKPFLSWMGIVDGQKPSDIACGLGSDQPLQFLWEWVCHRRQMNDVMYTPVGFVCQRRDLQESHFVFLNRGSEAIPEAASAGSTEYAGSEQNDSEDSVGFE